MIGQPTD